MHMDHRMYEVVDIQLADFLINNSNAYAKTLVVGGSTSIASVSKCVELCAYGYGSIPHLC